MNFLYSKQKSLTPIATMGLHRCENCCVKTDFYAVKAKTTLKLFFLPLFNWNEQLWSVCSLCKKYKKLTIEEFNIILKLPETYVTRDLIIKKEWFEYPVSWLLIIILLISGFFLYALNIPDKINTAVPTVLGATTKK